MRVRLIAILLILCSSVGAQDKCKCPDGFTKEYHENNIIKGIKWERVGSLSSRWQSKPYADTIPYPYFRCVRWFDFLGTGEKDHGEYADPICVKDTAAIFTFPTISAPSSNHFLDDSCGYGVWRYNTPPLDSSEIATLREMIREFKYRECISKAESCFSLWEWLGIYDSCKAAAGVR